jgi:hypothetical protein
MSILISLLPKIFDSSLPISTQCTDYVLQSRKITSVIKFRGYLVPKGMTHHMANWKSAKKKWPQPILIPHVATQMACCCAWSSHNLQYVYSGPPFAGNKGRKTWGGYIPTENNFNKLAKWHRKAVCHLWATSENKMSGTITKLQERQLLSCMESISVTDTSPQCNWDICSSSMLCSVDVISTLSQNVGNYQSMLRNIPEEISHT